MKKRVLLGVGMSVGLLLITEVSAAEPIHAPGQPAPTRSSAKEATVEENAAEAGADITVQCTPNFGAKSTVNGHIMK